MASNKQEDTGLETVKVIRFIGDPDMWREWSRKVQSYGKTKGWDKALVEVTGVTDKQKSDALNFLTLSLSGVAFAYVENASSAKECWDDLLEEFEPKSDMDAYDLAEEFTKCVL